jgi:hypothetical protein
MGKWLLLVSVVILAWFALKSVLDFFLMIHPIAQIILIVLIVGAVFASTFRPMDSTR